MTLRRAIFLVHLTTGCATAVVIFLLAATGFVLAWQKPIVAWQERGYRSAPAPGRSAISLDAIWKIGADSEGQDPSAILVPADTAAPVEVDFGREQRLFINRFSGAVLGPGALRTRAFFDAVTSLHRWFGAPLSAHASTKLVKGAFTLALLLMIVTGLCLWLPRVWTRHRLRAGTLLRFGLRGRAREWNQHNVVGIWSALPLTLITLTGIVLSYAWVTHLVYWATGSPEPAESSARTTVDALPEHPVPVSLQQIFDQTARQAIGWHQVRIQLPQAQDTTVDVVVDFSNGGRPDQQTRIEYSRVNGAALSLTTFSSFSPGRQIRSFMKYIHTGEAGGLAGETVAGITSLACSILVWTGLALALRRLQATRNAAGRAKLQQLATDSRIRLHAD